MQNRDLSPEKKVGFVRKVVLFFLFSGILFSYKLWTGNRDFPRIPVFETAKNIPDYVFNIVFYLFIGLILILFIRFKKIALILFYIFLGLLIVQDQNRLQPWVYMYILLLFPFLFLKENNERALHAILFCGQFILVCVYFWSGISKLNYNFDDGVVIPVLKKIVSSENQKLIYPFSKLGYLIPVTEIGIAFLLFWRKTRFYGFLLAEFAHLLIILVLSPIGISYNYTVIPWNICLAGLNFILFYKNKNGLFNGIKLGFTHIFIIIMAGFMPLLNLFGFWDDYLSFNLYSAKHKVFYISISDAFWPKIPQRYQVYLLKRSKSKPSKVIDVSAWSMDELNVPVYPEYRVYKEISKNFCKYGIPDSAIVYLMYEMPERKQNVKKWNCTN